MQFYSTQNASATAITFDADIKKIKVDGVELDLDNAGGGIFNNAWRGNFGGIRSGQTSVPANIANHMVYNASENMVAGVVTTASGNNYVFYNGRFTDAAQMPVSGRAVYNVGAATFTSGGSQMLSSNNLLTADFGTKKLTGELKSLESIGNIAVNADINGNKFASANGAAAQVEGGFFGRAAEEIGGIFKQGNAVGAFAGKQ